MLNDELLHLAESRIHLELDDRRDFFQREIDHINADGAKRGEYGSGGHFGTIWLLIKREYEIRAMLIWQVLSRVLSKHIEIADNERLKDILESQLDKGSIDIVSNYNKTAEHISNLRVRLPIENLRIRALDKVKSEIEISLLSVESCKKAGGMPATVNIYQPYGIVQTGAGSHAHFIHIEPIELDEINRALNTVERYVQDAIDIESIERNQIVEFLCEVRGELTKKSPNVHRLRGSLMAIAAAVQTLGSAASAYQLLKGAAALIGVYIP